ncbi:MAG: rane protein [Burkholderiaceae bacterium]|nr:rane protein [Burkholderiaceae bacterium]
MQTVPWLIFVARCAISATAAYLIADFIALPYPVWASMSAVIVSQERLNDTTSSLQGRIAGTIVGVCVALAVNLATSAVAGMAWQIMLAVGICAAIAGRYPSFRVCLWTAPIVLLTENASMPIAWAGFYRGSEVILGSIVGGAFHLLAERLMPVFGWKGPEDRRRPRATRINDE